MEKERKKERKKKKPPACLAMSIYMLSLCEALSQISTAHEAALITEISLNLTARQNFTPPGSNLIASLIASLIALLDVQLSYHPLLYQTLTHKRL
jgi:hypothetical protein